MQQELHQTCLCSNASQFCKKIFSKPFKTKMEFRCMLDLTRKQ
uniref:Uncharacterized protein n=1 Tax=Arundo donax TaxID=35708 RepID=A0A0A9FGJ8_ARUDO